jgi:multiple sugar transport system permease protein
MRRLIAGLVRAVFLALMVLFAMVPLYWMLVASLKAGDEQLLRGNPWWFEGLTLEHYDNLLSAGLFQHWLVNSLLVTASTLVISLAASVLAAYALVYLRVPFADGLGLGLFATYLLPQGILFLPLLTLLSRLHLTNSLWALVLTYPSLVIPFGTWVLWSFFRQLQPGLVEQARLEGAGVIAILFRVLLPLTLPPLAAVAIFGVAIVFNDFLYAFAFTNRADTMTLTGGVSSINVDLTDPGLFFAAVMLGTFPVALACGFFADTYARGLATGLVAD